MIGAALEVNRIWPPIACAERKTRVGAADIGDQPNLLGHLPAPCQLPAFAIREACLSAGICTLEDL